MEFHRANDLPYSPSAASVDKIEHVNDKVVPLRTMSTSNCGLLSILLSGFWSAPPPSGKSSGSLASTVWFILNLMATLKGKIWKMSDSWKYKMPQWMSPTHVSSSVFFVNSTSASLTFTWNPSICVGRVTCLWICFSAATSSSKKCTNSFSAVKSIENAHIVVYHWLRLCSLNYAL